MESECQQTVTYQSVSAAKCLGHGMRRQVGKEIYSMIGMNGDVLQSLVSEELFERVKA